MNKTPKLGQHFLKDTRALERIASVAEINSDDIIVEVGPGRGALTKYLLNRNPKKLIAIEKDESLAKELPTIFEESSTLEVIEGDILETLPKISPPYKLVGNIPYYLTGHLLRIIGELDKKPKLIVLTTQKEVAERMCALPPKMNLLSASVRFWGEPEIIRYISKKSFKPAPKVDSAIIKITPIERVCDISSRQFYGFLKVLFNQPRKTITNNISGGLGKDKNDIEKKLISLGIEPKLRPQNLSVEDIIQLKSHL